MTWRPEDNAYARWVQCPCDWYDIVDSTVGLGYADSPPGRRQAYLDLIAPHDLPAVQRQYGRLSGCALVALGWLRMLGLPDPELWAPYRPGRAVSDVVTIARRHGAWEPGATPEPGDIVLVASPEHVLCWLGDGWSVDGGQVDARGEQVVRRVKRPDRHAGGQRWIGGRRVVGVARIGALVVGRGESVRLLSVTAPT